MSKRLAIKLNSNTIDKLQHIQRRHTNSISKEFNNITDKSNCSFIQFDIEELYRPISKDILHQTLEFEKTHTNIDKNTVRIIIHFR